jgi:glucokinase
MSGERRKIVVVGAGSGIGAAGFVNSMIAGAPIQL